MLWIYIGIISLVSAIVCSYDKLAAKRKWRRVPEKHLFLLSAIGGAAIMFITMLLIRHKTRHFSFMFFVPLFALIHLFLVVWFGGQYNYWL